MTRSSAMRVDGDDDEAAQTDVLYPSAANDRPGWHVRLFGSREFFRLWLVQIVSATGDWLGLAAVIAFAQDLSGSETAKATAISLVLSVRLVPGFFFAPLAGVLVDRWDRKRVMVVCDLGRAVVLVLLPFAQSLWGLVVASLLLEVFTLLWSPAKEAIVPDLVAHDRLTTANSLSLAAAYGTFPVGTLLFASLAGLAGGLSGVTALHFLTADSTTLPFYADALSFCFSAAMVQRLTLVKSARRRETNANEGYRVDFSETFRELREGWEYIFVNHTVRAVNLGLAVAVIGGGMLVPVGALFSDEVLHAGAAGFGFFTTALGFGVAVGVVAVAALEKHLPKAKIFTAALLVAGGSLFIAASTSRLMISAGFVFVMGMAVGPVYVLGFAMLQSEVDDQLRGRVFATLNTLVRLCMLVSLTLGPLLVVALGKLSDSLVGGRISVAGLTVLAPGTRLTLWLSALIIAGAGVIAMRSLKTGEQLDSTSSNHPSASNTSR